MSRSDFVATLHQVEQAFAHRFTQPALVRQALTHRSAGEPHNERLEFLGDAVLGGAVAALLYRRFPAASEGDLSRARARLVRQETLASLAERLGLPDWLILGEGERRGAGHRRPSILSDAFEALVGALFLDAGFEAVATRVEAWFGEELNQIGDLATLKDPKTALQEWLQARHLPPPRYDLLEAKGPAHAQHFRVRVVSDALNVSAEGEGGSRRRAEQAAAAILLDGLRATSEGAS
ncbi:ribonuclease III [Hydrogenophilus islandicus]